MIFQSTLPSRGATHFTLSKTYVERISIHAPLAGSDNSVKGHKCSITDFNPRSPRGERLSSIRYSCHCFDISIHAPLAGSDAVFAAAIVSFSYFNPRSPRGERRSFPACRSSQPNFNPRSPRGERPTFTNILFTFFEFQSTLPSRGATLSPSTA